MEYTVEVTIETKRPLTAETLESVADIGGAASGNVGERVVSTTMTVKAATAIAAAQRGADLVLERAPGSSVIALSAMTCEEFDRRETEARERDHLVGLSEIAAHLEITKQRVSVLARREDFPTPVARLASGPVWRLRDLSTFAQGWQRKAGRPRKPAENAA